MFLSLVLVSASNFAEAQAGTNVSGVIFSDTAWTKADSPINITGPTAIAKGVTVTVEPGVIVRFNVNTLEVNGTFRVIGTNSEPITLDGGYKDIFVAYTYVQDNGVLQFYGDSNPWNEQTQTGCIIENTQIISLTLSVYSATVKVNKNVFGGSYHSYAIFLNGGNSIVTNNKVRIAPILVLQGAPLISNNLLIQTGIQVEDGSPSLIGNTIYVGFIGIDVRGGNVVASDNIVANMTMGFQITNGNVSVNRNLVLYCQDGFSFYSSANVNLTDNTIAYNKIGIDQPSPDTSIAYNNIEANVEHNLVWSYSSDFDCPNNWWGTTDESTIANSIIDYNNDFHLGNVNYIPYLQQRNNQAPSVESFVAPDVETSPPTVTPLPTQEPTANPTINPTIQPPIGIDVNWLLTLIVCLLAIIISLIGALIFLLHHKKATSP
jgi:hypothetical protein